MQNVLLPIIACFQSLESRGCWTILGGEDNSGLGKTITLTGPACGAEIKQLVESIRADFALNYAKKDYIAANRWRCSSYAYKQIWIPYICEKSQRGSLFKVKRSIIKHLYFARHLPKMFLFSLDRFLLAPTIQKLFSFFF